MYEKLILETLNDNIKLRENVKNLEERVMSLENQINDIMVKIETLSISNIEVDKNESSINQTDNIMRNIDLDNKSQKLKITRGKIKKYIIEKLKHNNSNFYIDIGNKEIKADIIIKDKNNNLLKSKCYCSKSYDENYPLGWHTIPESDLTTYDIYIFVIVYEDKYYSFLVKQSELINMTSKKRKDNSDNYHFSIQLDEVSSQFIDKRDNVNIKFANFYNKWELPFRLLENKG